MVYYRNKVRIWQCVRCTPYVPIFAAGACELDINKFSPTQLQVGENVMF